MKTKAGIGPIKTGGMLVGNTPNYVVTRSSDQVVDRTGNRVILSNGGPLITDDLIFSCPMNEPDADGASMFDRSGNNMHLLPFTNVIPSVDVGAGQYWRDFGDTKHCRLGDQFNAACSSLVSGRPYGIRTPGPFTLAFQFKRDETGNNHSLLGMWSTNNRAFLCRILSSAFHFYWSTDGVNTTHDWTHTTTVGDLSSHTVVIKFDGADVYINIDGNQDTFIPTAAYYQWTTGLYLAFGGVPALSNYYNGKIRNATMWLRAISDDEEDAWMADPSITQNTRPPVDVYVIAGQSNGDQQGTYTQITESDYRTFDAMHYLANPHYAAYMPACWSSMVMTSGDKYFGAAFGAEASFAKAMAAQNSNDIGVIQVAVGGTRLDPDDDQWYPGGATYLAALGQIEDAMDELSAAGMTATVRGILWIHGESDAADNESPNYAGWLETLASSLRTWLHTTKGFSDQLNIRFVISKLSEAQDASDAITMDQIHAIQAAQEAAAAAIPNAMTVETDDLSIIVGDSLHFNSASLITLGERLAGAASDNLRLRYDPRRVRSPRMMAG